MGIHDVESFVGLWNSSMEVLVILVHIRLFQNPNSSFLNYNYNNYGTRDQPGTTSVHKNYQRNQQFHYISLIPLKLQVSYDGYDILFCFYISWINTRKLIYIYMYEVPISDKKEFINLYPPPSPGTPCFFFLHILRAFL